MVESRPSKPLVAGPSPVSRCVPSFGTIKSLERMGMR